MVASLCGIVCVCMHVRVSLSVHVYLFAELICISTVCVDLCVVQLPQHGVCCLSEYLSSCSVEFAVESSQ